MLCMTPNLRAIPTDSSEERISGAVMACKSTACIEIYSVTIAPQFEATTGERFNQRNTKVVVAKELEILDFRLSIQEQVCA